MHQLSEKVSRVASQATRAVPHGPKTWNVYVDESRHSKRAFLLGVIIGGLSAGYAMLKKSEGAREELAERIEVLKVAARERTGETVDKVRPRVQEAIDKATSAVSDSAEAVQEKAGSASEKADRAGSEVSAKVGQK